MSNCLPSRVHFMLLVSACIFSFLSQYFLNSARTPIFSKLIYEQEWRLLGSQIANSFSCPSNSRFLVQPVRRKRPRPPSEYIFSSEYMKGEATGKATCILLMMMKIKMITIKIIIYNIWYIYIIYLYHICIQYIYTHG